MGSRKRQQIQGQPQNVRQRSGSYGLARAGANAKLARSLRTTTTRQVPVELDERRTVSTTSWPSPAGARALSTSADSSASLAASSCSPASRSRGSQAWNASRAKRVRRTVEILHRDDDWREN